MKTLYTIVLLAASVVALAQNFATSTQSGVDLRSYNSFTVIRGEVMIGEDNAIDRENFFSRFKESTVRELTLRGYQFTDDSTAQMRVSYVAKTSVQMNVMQLGPMGQAPTTNAADVSNSQSWSREFRQGSLIIVISDARKNETIWSAEGVVDATRSRGGDILDASIRNAFNKFPDKTKKEKSRKKKKD
ncbi:MAG: DUF4136 domain-containing protein [Cyclobacteriaceae bacterium]|nr:DUF4136 domain-containing protein [Cyclobacteriaceae bacterium]